MPELGQNNRFPNEPDGNMMPQDFGNRMPIGDGNNRPMPESVKNARQPMQNPSTILLLSVSVLVLLIGLFVAKKYKR